jgi:hypothetical protein
VNASREPTAKPPVICLSLLRVAAWLAPPDDRAEWKSRWTSRLWNLWILIDRGELAARGSVETALLCRAAIAAAFWMRFNPVTFRRWLRGPGALITMGGAGLLLLAMLSHGFRGLRELIFVTIDWNSGPRLLKYDPRADFVVGHFAAIVMAWTVGGAISTLCGRVLNHSGWKYWAFLGAKLLLIALLGPLVWLEFGGFLRANLPPGGPRAFLTTISTLFFFGSFGCCVVWAFADQRQRCPDCLGCMALPVTIGSWASVFNPVTTEFICDEGHGSLCLAESEMSGDDRWIKLDASWREF